MQLFIPSFWHPRPDCHGQVWQPRRTTSSLDGLRGYAAVAVMNYHILYTFQPFVFYGYGLPHAAATECARPEDAYESNLWFHQLPIIRLVYTGTWPISVFFVLSGFALSYNPLRESRKRAEGGDGDPAHSVVSSLLRRPIRLYGPPILASFVTMIAIQLGASEAGRKLLHDANDIAIVINEAHPTRFASFGSQLLDWAGETWRMLNVFWWGDIHNRYDVHLWTIPTEFRCSLAVFLILPAYVAVRQRIRKPLLAGLVLYVYTLDRWDVGLFYSGVLIADTSFSPLKSPVISGAKKDYQYSLYIAARVILFGLSLWLLSAPDFCIQSTPGFEAISRLIPSSDPAPFRFIPNLGGILLVTILAWTGSSNRLVSTCLDSPIPQYLGRISYSLYIVHGPLMHTLGYWLFPTLLSLTGTDETWNYVMGFSVAYAVFVATAIWSADLFCRMIDEPFVRLAKAAQNRISL
ncbi:acyltransferase 3 [Xylaria cf. heliscus]|nr:acyltransferase 3 [Xylaria cf. heliscus]